ncbi:MAG: ParA family protein [Haloarculaceae archaeon]
MSGGQLSALVGAVGGAGTTRLALEFGATLARDGRSALVVDAAYATQGLATAVPDRIGTDVTAAVTGERPLTAAAVGLDLNVPGHVAVAPARAPFERLARAKTSECARRLAERLSTAAGEYEHVLVDVPPVATNPSVAAVTAADRVGLVVPDAQRGADALPRTRDRLADVEAAADAVVVNATGDAPRDGDAGAASRIEAADATVPRSETTALADAPVCTEPSEFATAVAAATGAVVGFDLDLPEPESSSIADVLTG